MPITQAAHERRITSGGIACPRCHCRQCFVTDTRTSGDGTYTRRRRRCGICNHRFSTYDTFDLPDMTTSALINLIQTAATELAKRQQ